MITNHHTHLADDDDAPEGQETALAALKEARRLVAWANRCSMMGGGGGGEARQGKSRKRGGRPSFALRLGLRSFFFL